MNESVEAKPRESARTEEARREERRRRIVSRRPLALMIGFLALAFMVPSLVWRDREQLPVLLLIGCAAGGVALIIAWPRLKNLLLSRPGASGAEEGQEPPVRSPKRTALLMVLACVLGLVLLVGAAAGAVFILPAGYQQWIMPVLAGLIVIPLVVSGVRRAAALRLWEMLYPSAALLLFPVLLWPSDGEMAEVSSRVWLFLLLAGAVNIPVGLCYLRRWRRLARTPRGAQA